MKIHRIVIASDSFKGCLNSAQVNAAIASGVAGVLPDADVVSLPVADGGEGTVEALGSALGGSMIDAEVHNPLGSPVRARYAIDAAAETAVIEMAQASGLPLVEKELRNPLETNTYGVGELIADALGLGCRRILVGLGGSATNDGGAGMLSALGYRFIDAEGRTIDRPRGGNLGDIRSIDSSGADPRLASAEFILACDVTNPFTGPDGASQIFGPQKGADAAAVARLDAGMENLARVYERTFGRDIISVPGSGAAGGLAGGFIAAFGARVRPGVDMVLDAVGFDSALDGADLVITGEGRLDSQTAMGKTPAGVLRRARARNIPVVAFGGAIEDADALCAAGFAAVLCIQNSPLSLAEAMEPARAAEGLRNAAAQMVRLIAL